MAVENWIDEVCKLAGEVDNGKGGKVLSYSVFGKTNFPEGLSVFPCAISYVTQVESQYSSSGPCIDLWRGVTEFHLTEGSAKKDYPAVMRFFSRIRNAFALHRTLNGKVSYIQLSIEDPSLQGPVVLQYGTEQPHHGIVARWVVKENVTGQVTLGE